MGLALTLILDDPNAQRSVYNLALLAADDCKLFGQEEIKTMRWVVREAHRGVKTHGQRTSVLAKIASAREDGGDQDGIPVLKGIVDKERWRGAWFSEGADRMQPWTCGRCRAS